MSNDNARHTYVALVTAQGTACAGTVIRDDEDSDARRTWAEGYYCNGRTDDPSPGSWTDVTDNEVCVEYREGKAARRGTSGRG